MNDRLLRPAVLVACGVLLLAGCGTVLPSRQPDAVGTVGEVGSSQAGTVLSFVPDAGYEYFQGTLFVIDDSVTVVGPEGAATEGSDIPIGARVDVWTDLCAESFPVQCDVVAVRWSGGTL